MRRSVRQSVRRSVRRSVRSVRRSVRRSVPLLGLLVRREEMAQTDGKRYPLLVERDDFGGSPEVGKGEEGPLLLLPMTARGLPEPTQ